MPQALANSPNTGYTYGVDSFYDGPCARSYDPWEHADQLGVPVISNMTLPDEVVAAYSRQMNVIFFRAGLPEDVERCAIAHEIVHFENHDEGHSKYQEDRADRTSTLRLIRPSDFDDGGEDVKDLAEIARELRVTEKVMRLYASMARNGTLPRR